MIVKIFMSIIELSWGVKLMNHFAASTLGYPVEEQQRLEADIIIIAQRQDHRPSQNQIELMRSKIQNKEGGIMSYL